MAKPKTYPLILEESLRIDLKVFKSLLMPSTEKKTIVLEWQQQNPISGTYHEAGSIDVTIIINAIESFLELSYSINNQDYNQIVEVVSVPSNIFNGKIWYMRCPQCSARCRHLYLHKNVFNHRKCIKNFVYSKDTYSKYHRKRKAQVVNLNKVSLLQTTLNQKYAKKFYKGKITKSMKKLKQQLSAF